MATSINTDLNIYDLRHGGKMAVAGKKTYHPCIGHIRCAVYSIVSMRPPLSGEGRIPDFKQKDPDCPYPLEQFNVALRTGVPIMV